MKSSLNIAILGLSITSSWGNGHAVTYRALVKTLLRRGHHVLFLERDCPWYAENRDFLSPSGGETALYKNIGDLKNRFSDPVKNADFVIIGSYVPQGVDVSRWVLETAEGPVAFYDIDTPVTLSRLQKGNCEYLCPDLIPQFSLYLSFTGGPLLRHIETVYGSPAARPLYCSVDMETYFPEPLQPEFDFGYMGTYSPDRQPALERLLIDPARKWKQGRFIVAGPQYPKEIEWPGNVRHVEHLPPAEHRRFYRSMRFTLNITRKDMVIAGYSPSIRLFEAGACAVPVISDYWEGLDTFFTIGEEILVSRSSDETLEILKNMSEEDRLIMARKAAERTARDHTTERRVSDLEAYIEEIR